MSAPPRQHNCRRWRPADAQPERAGQAHRGHRRRVLDAHAEGMPGAPSLAAIGTCACGRSQGLAVTALARSAACACARPACACARDRQASWRCVWFCGKPTSAAQIKYNVLRRANR